MREMRTCCDGCLDLLNVATYLPTLYILLVWHVVTGRSAAFITVWDELAEAAGSTPPSMSTKSKARKWRRARRRQKQRQEKVKVSKSKSGKKRVLQMVVSLSKATLSICCFPQPYFLYILIPAYILYAVYVSVLFMMVKAVFNIKWVSLAQACFVLVWALHLSCLE